MGIIVDTHVHIYPCYDVPIALANLFDNLSRIGGSADKAVCLAERYDCHFFDELKRDGGRSLGAAYDMEVVAENALRITAGAVGRLWLFAGRQIVTAERIEILALTVGDVACQGDEARNVVRKILADGGKPVVSWAPGKWFFKRGSVVEAQMREFSPGDILFGDTSLRPLAWKTL